VEALGALGDHAEGRKSPKVWSDEAVSAVDMHRATIAHAQKYL
jgi:hypothetical protein